MQIRKRLAFQFIAIVACLLFLSSLSIYLFSADYRKDDFYNRMYNKAANTAKLLIEVEEVDANLLKKIEKDNPSSLIKERIIIYNFKDELIYDSQDESVNDFKITKGVLDQIRLEQEIRFDQGNREVLGFLFADKYDRFVVVIGAIDLYGLNKLKNLRTVLLLVFGISILLVFVSGWFYAGRALSPITEVIRQVDEISISSLNLRVKEGNGRDEIATLAATFNNMLSRLESAFNMQKDFIANASHELRTPITSITGQLEVVLMNERTTFEYKEAMMSVLEDIKNLSSISNRMLLLAQASSETARAAFTNCRIDELIWQSRSELNKRNPAYKIDVSIDAALDEEQKLTIHGNEQLLKTAILNLMDNGCKYSDDHQVFVTLGQLNQNLILSFTDNGIGIEAADLSHIFEPLFRGKNTFKHKGHGIGLSLVERIINLHTGRITVQSFVNKGTTFEVHLPKN